MGWGSVDVTCTCKQLVLANTLDATFLMFLGPDISGRFALRLLERPWTSRVGDAPLFWGVNMLAVAIDNS